MLRHRANQLQEAMRFTIINHRSEVYKLAQTDRFRNFKERAETLSNSLDMFAIDQMRTEIEKRKNCVNEDSTAKPQGPKSA